MRRFLELWKDADNEDRFVFPIAFVMMFAIGYILLLVLES